jgi:hypothetical protein
MTDADPQFLRNLLASLTIRLGTLEDQLRFSHLLYVDGTNESDVNLQRQAVMHALYTVIDFIESFDESNKDNLTKPLARLAQALFEADQGKHDDPKGMHFRT